MQTALEAAYAAGEEILRSRAHTDLGIVFKGETNLVTEFDLRAERIICAIIRKRFPSHRILSEEDVKEASSKEQYVEPLWVVDPIDGTTNFAHRHHMVAVSIAFLNNGITEVGVVHAPFLNETFTAIRGRGACMNDARIRVSTTTDPRNALLATGFPYDRDDIEVLLNRLREVLLHCREIRRLGSGALDICWVAMGRLDGYYETIQPWDMAAGSLVLKEAGGAVDYLGKIPADLDIPLDLYSVGYVCANPGLLPKIVQILRKAEGDNPKDS